LQSCALEFACQVGAKFTRTSIQSDGIVSSFFVGESALIYENRA
jgi:hypothetical protein